VSADHCAPVAVARPLALSCAAVADRRAVVTVFETRHVKRAQEDKNHREEQHWDEHDGQHYRERNVEPPSHVIPYYRWIAQTTEIYSNTLRATAVTSMRKPSGTSSVTTGGRQ